jgi:hypothetical protein
MYIDQLPYRELHDDILSYEHDALFDDLLLPWLRQHDDERRWLETIRTRRGAPIPAMEAEESCRLYALSRIVDLLQLSFAPRTREDGWDVAPVTGDEFARFMDALGLEQVERTGFHPFHHEIVTVDPLPETSAPPRVVEICWPGYTLGPLLISRAGVRVEAGEGQLLKPVAEHSVLYWAYARNNRKTKDLARGWGGNSQWRTSFRRDYALDGTLYYNADAARDHPGSIDTDLLPAERAELLRHRCFVACTRHSDDRWPYSFTLVESA